MICMTLGYSTNCTYTVKKFYFNEHILTFYIDSFDSNNSKSQDNLFTYEIIPEGTGCSETTITINYKFKIYVPEIGLTSYETFYEGKVEIIMNSEVQYFKNSDFSFVSGPTVTNNAEVKKIISYISQSGKLPNGIYSFHFSSNNLEVITPQPETIEIYRPITLELSSPGGVLSELSQSYIYTTVPLFIWYSDFCTQCIYGIRICEYNKNEHSSLNSALNDWSILPYDQSNEYHEIPWNSSSFQYTTEDHIDLEVGKHYVWQIRRSYETTLEAHHDYSPIHIFEIRDPIIQQIDIIDPYLSAIQALIGKEQFNLWFNTGGELDRFVISGKSIWINGEELPINTLYSLVSELNNGTITLDNFQIK